MASALGPLKTPQCSSCIRQLRRSFEDGAWNIHSPFRQQVRGKRRLPKSQTINVRLLRDIPHYGRQGTIMAIAPGRMRNIWYPKRLAEYMTTTQLKSLGLQDSVVERDSTFGVLLPQPKPDRVEVKTENISRRVNVEMDLLTPERVVELISMLVPPNLDFYEKTITAPPPTPLSPSIPATSSLSAAAAMASREGAQSSERTSIYGSVSTADIASNLTAVLAEDDEGSRIVLGSEDISFVEREEEADRVKHLGIYEIEIRVKGAPDSVRRTVKVNEME